MAQTHCARLPQPVSKKFLEKEIFANWCLIAKIVKFFCLKKFFRYTVFAPRTLATLTSTFCRISQLSLKSATQIRKPAMHDVTHYIRTTGPPVMAHPDALHRCVSMWSSKSSSTCCSLGSYIFHQVPGPSCCTWCPKRLLVIGSHAGTIDP